METVISGDSPLAEYLEANGEADTVHFLHPPTSDTSAQHSPSFAPRGRPKPRSYVSHALATPTLQSGLFLKIRKFYAAAVNSTLGSEDNERFLDHFRYLIIASQLLNDHLGPISAQSSHTRNVSTGSLFPRMSATTNGALLVALFSFSFAAMIHWAKGGVAGGFSLVRFGLVFSISLTITIVAYAYATRQWLLHLRRRVIESTSSFISNLQSFESSSSTLVTLIQEVELVSRGYRISSPMPPVSRIEGECQSRRCLRLRRNLLSSYASAIPALMNATATARALVHDDDLERFLDVYDVRNEDLQEASLGYTEGKGEENTSLKNIRIHQARYGTIRRLLLCCLLSQEATGRRSDAPRWQTIASTMDQIGNLTKSLSENLAKLLNEEERIPSPNGAAAGSPTSPLHKAKSSHTRLQSEVRRISTLSTGIRSLQAKIYLLREESTQALSTPTSDEELSSVSASLRDQYDALGEDLHALMQAWESGKQALNRDISSQSRIVSRSASVDISRNAAKPLPHEYHGLVSVEEGNIQSGTQSASLMNGTGPLPLSPPSTEDGSSDPGADDEVFEAISSPRQRERSTLTRDQRIAKMHEERERQVSARENRDTSSNMVKELQSVIKLRPVVGKKRESAARARVTSM